jgi:hypothetical protein
MNSVGFGGNVYPVATAYVETKGGGEGQEDRAQGRRRRGPVPSSAALPAVVQGQRLVPLSAARLARGCQWGRGTPDAAPRRACSFN